MRAIIIDDKDARALLDSLKLEELLDRWRSCDSQHVDIREMHRTFHYIVCQWLQDQGATVTR